MELFENINYIIEILAAELIFLWCYPRRNQFGLRLSVICAVLLVIGYFENMQRTNTVFGFLGMVALLGMTAIGMFLTFQASFLSIFSACIGGVALQHISHHVSFLVTRVPGMGTWNPLWEFFTCFVLDAAVLLLLRGPLRRTRYYENHDWRITAVSLLIVLLCTGVTRLLRLSGNLNTYGVICTALYAIICCALALFLQFSIYYFVMMRSEYLLVRRIREEERQQYEVSREKAELVNIKCHDLKHKLRALEHRLPKAEIDSMREIIDSYDGTYHTGLDVLDIILNEKSLRCRSRNISLTYMGPGAELSFLDTMDIYSMFGNILENAITAADQFQDAERRVISMAIERRGNLVLINTSNYLGQTLSFEDGIPQSTKEGEPGYHGYGLKSIREIAKRYHGDISVSAADGIFQLSVYLMNE